MTELTEILSPSRTRCRVAGNSKKRLFEEVAELVAAEQEGLDPTDIITALLAREKLGSTGLGQGIAIPHCRLEGCTQALGVLMSLASPTDFDAPDDEPVDLLCVLIVPGEASQEHLEILATLAKLFSQEALCNSLRACERDRELYDTLIGWEG
jgi:PTS system nitrogen regulatory IIA component